MVVATDDIVDPSGPIFRSVMSTHRTIPKGLQALVLVLTVVAFCQEAAAQIVVADPTELDFGDLFVGYPDTLDITIWNTSTGGIVVSNVYFDSGEEGFTRNENGDFQLTPNEGRTFQVAFSPSKEGVRVDTLRVETTGVPPLGIPVTGVGIFPPAISVDPDSLGFDDLEVGQQEIRTIAVFNDGLGELVVDRVLKAGLGANAASFRNPSDGFSLAPGASKELDITFQPTAGGARKVTLRFESNDPASPLYILPVTGFGVTFGLTVAPDPFQFGGLPVGQSRFEDVTLTNTGTGTIQVTSVRLEGEDADEFNVAEKAFDIESGETHRLGVQFAPIRRGRKEATLVVESTIGEHSVTLNGLGEGPFMNLSVDSVAFKGPVGATIRQPVVIRNDGELPLTLFETRVIDPSEVFSVEFGGGGRTIQPGNAHTLQLAFEPFRLGAYTGTLSLRSDDLIDQEQEVILFGEGVTALSAPDSTLLFGSVRIGEERVLGVRLRNNATNNIVVSQLNLEGSNQFAVSTQTPFTVGAGQEVSLPVAFVPVDRGGQNAVIRITSTDLANPVLEVQLRGSGVAPIATIGTLNVVFGTFTVGRSSIQNISIQNDGNIDLAVDGVSIGGSGGSVFALEGDSTLLIPPGQSENLVVRFIPTAAEAYQAQLQFNTDDPEQPVVQVALSGNGALIGNQSPQVAQAGTPIETIWIVPEDLQAATGQVYFRRSGSSAYQSVPLERQESIYRGTLPAESVSLRGLQYYASFSLGDETLTHPVENAALNPERINVQVDNIASPIPFQPETYRMISIPLDLEVEDAVQVLGATYGPYNPARWRLLRWQVGTHQYDEGEQLGRGFSPGTAFWLITSDGRSHSVNNGTSVDSSQPFVLSIPPGWAQIANPFAFPVSASDISSSGAFQGPYFYDGQEYQLNWPVLVPWEGYFIFNPGDAPIEFSIPPVEASGSPGKHTVDASSKLEADFQIQLKLVHSNLALQDTQNFIGLVSEAEDGYDTINLFEPPSIGQFVRLSIVDGERKYASLYRKKENEGQHWDFEVSVSQDLQSRDQHVELMLQEYHERPEHYNVYLLDMDAGYPLDVQGPISFRLPSEQSVRRFRLIIGTEGFAEAHSENVPLEAMAFGLYQNYPNPFNPQTSIAYSLGKTVPVRLEIYNVLGQRLRVMVAGEQPAGRYEVVWDGRDEGGQEVGSGVYVYRLQAGTYLEARTMILLR